MPTYCYERLDAKGAPTGEVHEFHLRIGAARERMTRKGVRYKRRFDVEMGSIRPMAPPGAYPRIMWNYSVPPTAAHVEAAQRQDPHLHFNSKGHAIARSRSDLHASAKMRGHEYLGNV